MRVHGGGARGRRPPTYKLEENEAVRGHFNLFHLYFTNEIRGGGSAYMQHGRGWADRHVSMVGGGEGALPPPLEMGKKDAARRNYNLSPILY